MKQMLMIERMIDAGGLSDLWKATQIVEIVTESESFYLVRRKVWWWYENKWMPREGMFRRFQEIKTTKDEAVK